MKIPNKMFQEFKPIIKPISFQTGFSNSQWGGSYIYKNNAAAHIGIRMFKEEGFMTQGETIFYVGDDFIPKTAVDNHINRYLNGYAMSEDGLVGFIGNVLIKVDEGGLAVVYFQQELDGKIKSIVIPEQQYIL